MKAAPCSLLRFNSAKHHPLLIALHWSMAIAIVAAAAAALLREFVDDRLWRILLLDAHRQIGLFVLVGVAARLGVRLCCGMADHLSGSPRLLRIAAAGAHCAMYGAMVGLPLLGWATTNAHNLQVRLFGLIQLPALAGVDAELADRLSDKHILAGWILLGLVVLHTAAALYHHLVRRDRVVWAMLPGLADRVPVRLSKPPRGNSRWVREAKEIGS